MNYEQRLLDACPSFREKYDDFLSTWVDCAPSFHNVLIELADHIAIKDENGSSDELKVVLSIVEEMQTKASKEQKDTVNIALLEQLQSRTKEYGLQSDIYFDLLGPITKCWWNDLSENWEGRYDW